MYSVKILKDSIAPCGSRLTSWELTYPRMVHAELLTHRLFSRNSASSRAIPTEKLIQRVLEDPALPVYWGSNQRGMQAGDELAGPAKAEALAVWLEARDSAVAHARKLHALGLHKQLANRVIEPWMFITVIVSATEFSQWFHQRHHRDAQPEIRWVAQHMWPVFEASQPQEVPDGGWHLPLVDEDDIRTLGDPALLCKVATGRCARVSYLTHDGRRDHQEDIGLHDRLRDANPGHWSPFEHVAMALSSRQRIGNFVGWKQYRKFFAAEHVGGSLDVVLSGIPCP